MEDDPIRAVSRALELLRALNAEQSATLHQLHLRTGLPKSTLSRLLKTLIHEGYAQAEGSVGTYRLTDKVQELSNGYTHRALVVDAGSRIAVRVTREIRWPLAIGTLDGDALVVRYSTMPYSPLAMHATTLGQRLGLLDTAMGRVYLAHCDAGERSALRELLRVANAPATAAGPLPIRGQLDAELQLIQRQGYAVRLPNARRATATIAVAVMHEDAAIAALGLTTFGRMMTAPLIAQLLPVLQATAGEIAEAYAARLPQA